MAYLLFIDESGTDGKESPYEVLAGIAVKESRVWSLIRAIHDAEELHFGCRISDSSLELKGKKLLKRKTFKHAAVVADIPRAERTQLARSFLEEGKRAVIEGTPSSPTRRQFAALGQAKIAFCEHVLELCAQHQVRVVGSIVDRWAPKPQGSQLRKDFSYLFQRFFYFLEDRDDESQGIVVFDERDHQQCVTLLQQMSSYFKDTATGRHRASRVIPEPFFVRSELCTLVQVADIIAYVISWGVRIPPKMSEPARSELESLANQVKALRFRIEREQQNGDPFHVWSLAIIDDLRPRSEK
ncbi:MAG: DUF3800 domain-containing protein [Deltaproteobacteria bacterium]|nr:DUF3800 domain-containing protein [Deltaproteobacteria bacterium]